MTRTGWIVSALALIVVLAIWLDPFGGGQAERADGATMVDVTMPSLNGAAADGQPLFAANCAACHGEKAGGLEGLGPPLVHKIYEPNHHADMAVRLAVQNGVRQHHWTFGNMAPVEGVSDDEVGRIIAYLRTLQEANGIF